MDIEQMKKDLGGGNVFPIGEENVVFAKYFTGECYLNMLTTERVPVGLVTFAPGTINAYHIHHKGGQILMVTGGRGWYQEEGKPARELKAGDHVEVKVTFPEEYQAKELAGKEAVFQCDVKKVEAKELPELDDDFAQDASEFDTLAEYKEDIKKNLTEKKEKEARAAKENAAVDKAIENAQMEIPDAMLNTQVRQMLDDFSRRMQSQGLTMEQYFQFTGMTLEKMQEEMKPQALKRIQTRLVLEKIAEVENIQPTDEEVEEEFKKMADAYKMEVEKS